MIRSVSLERDGIDLARYPFSIPAIAALTTLELDPHVTLFAGENGSGKSTLVEAIAIAAGFNAEGGSRNMAMSTRASHSAGEIAVSVDTVACGKVSPGMVLSTTNW